MFWNFLVDLKFMLIEWLKYVWFVRYMICSWNSWVNDYYFKCNYFFILYYLFNIDYYYV